MKIYLERFGSTPFGTFGVAEIGGEKFYTVEKPWKNNEPRESCIPLGNYYLNWMPTTTPVPYSFEDHTWYLIGNGVGYDHGQRTRCAFHIGNTAKDVSGCIAWGRDLGFLNPNWAITSSTNAMSRLYTLLGPYDHEIVISQKLLS